MRLRFGVNFGAFFNKFLCFLFQTNLERKRRMSNREMPATAGKLHADWATSEKQRSRRRGRYHSDVRLGHIGKVTAALPLRTVVGSNFQIPQGLIFRNPTTL